VGIGGSQSGNLEEELTLRRRYVEFTGTLRPDQAQLLQQGVVGMDLVGKHTIDLFIRVTARQPIFVINFTDLIAQGQPKSPDDDSFYNQTVILPQNQRSKSLFAICA
jgi:hypothetical protein